MPTNRRGKTRIARRYFEDSGVAYSSRSCASSSDRIPSSRGLTGDAGERVQYVQALARGVRLLADKRACLAPVVASRGYLPR